MWFWETGANLQKQKDLKAKKKKKEKGKRKPNLRMFAWSAHELSLVFQR